MILKNNETRNMAVKNATINGLNICVLLQGVNSDTVPLTGYRDLTAFDPSNVSIEVALTRNGQKHILLNTNLALIAHYQTIMQTGRLWLRGGILRKNSDGVAQIVTRNLFLHLGGHYNLNGEDQILVTASVNRGTFGSALSASDCNIQIEANTSIGVEKAIFQQNFYSIQANQNSDNVNLGDNVTRIALISFEKDPAKAIFKSATLASDRLDWNANEQELLLRFEDKFPYSVEDRLTENIQNETQNPFYFPATRLIHDFDEIDKAKLSFQLYSDNVQASQNFIAYTTFLTSWEMLDKAKNLMDKHSVKNQDKVPLSH